MPIIAGFFEIDDLYVLCAKPSASVLFQRQKVKHSKFDDLDDKSIPNPRSSPWKDRLLSRSSPSGGNRYPCVLLSAWPATKSRAPPFRAPSLIFTTTYRQRQRWPPQIHVQIHAIITTSLPTRCPPPENWHRVSLDSSGHRLLAEMERLENSELSTLAAMTQHGQGDSLLSSSPRVLRWTPKGNLRFFPVSPESPH